MTIFAFKLTSDDHDWTCFVEPPFMSLMDRDNPPPTLAREYTGVSPKGNIVIFNVVMKRLFLLTGNTKEIFSCPWDGTTKPNGAPVTEDDSDWKLIGLLLHVSHECRLGADLEKYEKELKPFSIKFSENVQSTHPDSHLYGSPH